MNFEEQFIIYISHINHIMEYLTGLFFIHPDLSLAPPWLLAKVGFVFRGTNEHDLMFVRQFLCTKY